MLIAQVTFISASPNHSIVVKARRVPSSFTSVGACTLATRPTIRMFGVPPVSVNSNHEGYVSLGVVTVRSHRPENGWLPSFFDKAGVRAAAVTINTRQSDFISYIVYLNCGHIRLGGNGASEPSQEEKP